MTYANMKYGIVYEVTKSSEDGTFIRGDIIALCKDGSILSHTDSGWLDKDELEDYPEVLTFECVPSERYYFYREFNCEGIRLIPKQVSPWQAQLDEYQAVTGMVPKIRSW